MLPRLLVVALAVLLAAPAPAARKKGAKCEGGYVLGTRCFVPWDLASPLAENQRIAIQTVNGVVGNGKRIEPFVDFLGYYTSFPAEYSRPPAKDYCVKNMPKTMPVHDIVKGQPKTIALTADAIFYVTKVKRIDANNTLVRILSEKTSSPILIAPRQRPRCWPDSGEVVKLARDGQYVILKGQGAYPTECLFRAYWSDDDWCGLKFDFDGRPGEAYQFRIFAERL
jgi:hypothetical protein